MAPVRFPLTSAIAGLVASTVLLVSPAWSGPVAGQSEPEFMAAVDLWLTGDEAAALPRLAALAQDQNAAAQILLGMIDTTPALQGDWLMALPRADRITLLRDEGGFSGQNWMRSAAVTEPLAQTWLALWSGDAAHGVMLDFGKLGELRAARVAAMTLARREKTGFSAIADDPAYPTSVRVFAIREWRVRDPARAAREEAALAPDDPQGEIIGHRDNDPAAWLMAHAEGDPLVALCATLCPDAPQAACQTAAYQAVGGYWPVMALGSPIETIIPSDRFNRSPAGMASVMRQLQGDLSENACLGAAMK
jgi:hypothetical protein